MLRRLAAVEREERAGRMDRAGQSEGETRVVRVG